MTSRGNLAQYSGNKAISSEMLRGNNDYSYGGNVSGSDASLERLKDSVSDFFDTIGRR